MADRAATDRFRRIFVIRGDLLWQARAFNRTSARGMAGEEQRQYDARLIERSHSGLARKYKGSSEPCRLHQRLQLVPYVKALEICCRDKGPQMRCLTTAGEFFRQRPERKRKR